MIGRRIKISKEDRKKIVDYLKMHSAMEMESFLSRIKLPK